MEVSLVQNRDAWKSLVNNIDHIWVEKKTQEKNNDHSRSRMCKFWIYKEWKKKKKKYLVDMLQLFKTF